MNVLGQLGIDWWLVTAQIVNFVLLLWILKKYVYTPLIKRLERDEKDRADAAKGLQRLEEEKKQLMIDRDASLSETKKRSSQILEEAEAVAEEVKKTMLSEAQESKRVLLAKADQEVNAQKVIVIEEEKKKLQARVRQRLVDTISKMRDSGALHELQRKYADPMIAEIKDAPLTDTQNINHVTLEYGTGADGGDVERIKNSIREKVGHDFSFDVKDQSDLIAGFRVEIGGVQLNHNLIDDITYATHNETP